MPTYDYACRDHPDHVVERWNHIADMDRRAPRCKTCRKRMRVVVLQTQGQALADLGYPFFCRATNRTFHSRQERAAYFANPTDKLGRPMLDDDGTPLTLHESNG